MTYTVDLDAIMARADAATEGPWARSGHNIGHIVYDREGPCELAGPVMLGHILGEAGHEDAEFIAHAREDIPSLISLVRELQAGIPARVVLDGDPDEIEAALDALPFRTVVTSEAFGEPGAFIKGDGISVQFWHGAGRTQSYYSRHLARYCAPLVVVR